MKFLISMLLSSGLFAAIYNNHYKAPSEHPGNPTTTQDNIDVLYYHLRLNPSLDSQHLEGNTSIRFKALQNLSTITLDFATGFRVYKIEGARGYNHVKDKLEITLQDPINANSVGEVRVYYRGHPPVVTDGSTKKGMIWEKHGADKDQVVIATLSTPYLAHFWYPCKDGVADKADSVAVDITVKDTIIKDLPVMGVSNGILTKTIVENKQRTYCWKHRYPITPFYVLMAVSNYRNIKGEASDYAKNTYPLNFYIFDEAQKQSDASIRRMPEVMSTLSDVFGPYPFKEEGYAITQIGFYSGIETQGNAIVVNLKSDPNLSLLIHEAAHSWFGNDLTCAEWGDAWLHEGFASYSEGLWKQYRNGEDAYKERMKTWIWRDGGTLRQAATDNPFRVFTPIVYTKGAMVVHMLRNVMTDPYFFEMTKKLPADKRYRFKNLTTEDFQAFCEKICGDDLEYFFKEWVYGEYFPIYDFAWQLGENGNPPSITINQQLRTTTPNYFIMPIDITMVYTDGTKKVQRVFNDLASQKFTLEPEPGKTISDVLLDQHEYIFKELRYAHQILNIKTPLTLKTYEVNSIGRKFTFLFDTKKSQDLDVTLTDDKGNVVFSTKLAKVSTTPVTLEIPDASAKTGQYKLRIIGKSDIYTYNLKVF